MAYDEVVELLLGALLSWHAVYVVLVLPAVLLLLNFVAGDCFVSHALHERQQSIQSVHSSGRRYGRLGMSAVVVGMIWQYYAFFYDMRASETSQCDPVAAVLMIVDNVAEGRMPFGSSLWRECEREEAVFLILLGAYATAFVACVVAVPQVPAEHPRSCEATYCHACGGHVLGMDHHCYFIGNCVGRRSRARFLAFILCAAANLSCVVWSCGRWAAGEGGPIQTFGLVLAISFDLWLLALCVVHALLYAMDVTSRDVARTAHAQGQRWLPTFFQAVLSAETRAGIQAASHQQARKPGA